MEQPTALKLSICIATYKRAKYIGETLSSIAAQLSDDVELVVVDGASPDDTSTVVSEIAGKCSQLRYFRETENSGIDADYDKAVRYAKGEFCWLMTDDDVLVPDAVARVLSALQPAVNLVVLNAEVRDAQMSRPLQSPRMNSVVDLSFDGGSIEDCFRRLGDHLSFIGGVVIRRECWMARERQRFFGSVFVHFGVIFQSPTIGNVTFIARPLITIRYGNALWTPRSFEIWTFKWPHLVWSFGQYSDDSKRSICRKEPWRSATHLLIHRACGSYSQREYETFLAPVAKGLHAVMPWLVARMPGSLVNVAAVVFLGLFRRRALVARYDLLRSRHAAMPTRVAARLLAL